MFAKSTDEKIRALTFPFSETLLRAEILEPSSYSRSSVECTERESRELNLVFIFLISAVLLLSSQLLQYQALHKEQHL